MTETRTFNYDSREARMRAFLAFVVFFAIIATATWVIFTELGVAVGLFWIAACLVAWAMVTA